MKRSSPIHITVRPVRQKPTVDSRRKLHTISTNNKVQKSFQSLSNTKIEPYDHVPSQSIGIRSDRKEVTQDHHKTSKKHKKKLCSVRRILISVCITGLAVIAIAATLIEILYKSKRQTMPVSGSTPLLRWNTTGITVTGLSNTAGNASNQLNHPKGIIWHYPNILYAADCDNHRIQKYELDNSVGVTVAGETNGIGGSLPSQLKTPSCILIDSSNGIYVSDSGNNRVQYWSNGAFSGITVAGSSTGILGSTNSTLSTPVGLARNETTGTLYIADFDNNRVMSYLLNAGTGTLAAGNGTFGAGSTQLWKPAGLYLDTLSNSLVIANHNAQNIVRWGLGANNWTILAGDASGTARSGNNVTLFNNPQQMTFDPMGNMYVVDRNNHRIQLFMAGSTEGITIAGITSSSGSTSTLLNTPNGIALDNQLNLYVADTNNHRIQKFLRY